MNTKYICVDSDKNQLYAYPKVANATVFQKHMEKAPNDTCLNFLPLMLLGIFLRRTAQWLLFLIIG